jgi:uncharacterized DUF497 family protein
MDVRKVVWDSEKDTINRREHNIGFAGASKAIEAA